MAIKVNAAFGTGELDPALYDRTTLQKYDTGLATARNVIIGKTGRVVSRAGRKNFAKIKTDNSPVVIYYPPNTGVYLEFGVGYVREYMYNGADTVAGTGTKGTMVVERASTYTLADLPKLQFDTTSSGSNISTVYIFCGGKPLQTFVVSGISADDFSLFPFGVGLDTPVPQGIASSSTTATGYQVEYRVTVVWNRSQENVIPTDVTGTTFKLPVLSGEKNSFRINITAGSSVPSNLTSLRVYRRPVGGGEYGFIGSTSVFGLAGGYVYADFQDFGTAPDYNHIPPSFLPGVDVPNLNPATGGVYQQRLIITDTATGGEGLIASRPGYKRDFTRDYPLNAGSALQFKAGTSGRAKILRIVDSDGLIVFTNLGVYINVGTLTPDNIALDRKGAWVIDVNVPPLVVPGGVVFVDTATNSIRVLEWSTENATYNAPELSAFSNHLFLGRKVTSMAFQSGDLPCLWVVFDDGTYASLTYEKDQEMRAWTRHDSDPNIKVEQVISTNIPNRTLFLVNKSGVRYVEETTIRYVSGGFLLANPEAPMFENAAFMDSMVSVRTNLTDLLASGQMFSVTPVTTGVWSGPLTLTCQTSALFTVGGYGAIGTRMRYFDSDMVAYTLRVTARASDNSVTVQPDIEWPSTLTTGFRLYATVTQVTGLSYMENEYPVVMVDGGVLGSPNNNFYSSYPSPRVIGGVLTLPMGMYGSIIHIGRAITADIETLDVATVEQRPTLIESKTLNKLYIRVLKARGLFVGNTFPANNKVAGMEDADEGVINYNVDPNGPLMGNTYEKPYSRRIEKTIPGDWQSQGRACIRQVDPVHFELLSIIPDLDDERR